MGDLQQLLTDIDSLIREYTHDVERAFVGGGSADGVIRTYETKRRAMESRIDTMERQKLLGAPDVSTQPAVFFTNLKKNLRDRMQAVTDYARRASDGRSRVNQGVRGEYNKIVGKGLNQLAGRDLDRDAEKAIAGQISSLVKKHLGEQVPGNVRAQIGNELAKQIVTIPALQDGFYWAEGVLIDIASYLDRRLTFTREIGQITSTVSGQKVPPEQVAQLNGEITPRAKAAADLDKQVAEKVTRSQTSIKGSFSLKPKLVLDPAVRFVKSVDASIGLTIQNGGATLKLKNDLTVTTPFTDDRQLKLHTNASLAFQGNMLQLGYRANSGFNNLGALGQGTVYGRYDHKVSNNASFHVGGETNLGTGDWKAFAGFKISF